MEMFNIEDIQDVRVIIKANDKHYSLVCDDTNAGRMFRLIFTRFLLEDGGHRIVLPSLEDIHIAKEITAILKQELE